MIKKILFVQIVSLILCSCSSFPLEEKPVSYVSDGLSKDEKILIMSQVEDKWIPVVGDRKNIKVTISLELEIDGTVTKAEIKSITCPPGAEQICQLVAESAKRAVKNASPIKNLQPDRYDLWKKFDLDFYPGDYRSQ
jgi:hypothetical protein